MVVPPFWGACSLCGAFEHQMEQEVLLGKKPALKEKVVLIYDALFKGDDFGKQSHNVWHELFLLKVNVRYLSDLIDGTSEEELFRIKDHLNLLFAKCCAALKEEHQIKVVNSLQTLCTLINCVFKKKFSESGFDVINVLIGFDDADYQMQRLIECANHFIIGEYSISLKNLTLKLLLIMATAIDNISQNMLLEYLMMYSVFDSIAKLLADPVLRNHHGHEAVLLLAVLLNYRKYETTNPYLVKLSIMMDDEMALNGLGLVIAEILSNCNKKYALQKAKAQPAGFFGSLTSFVGSMFVGQNDTDQAHSAGNDAVLLALYEAVHLNRNFFTVLSHVISNDEDQAGGGTINLHPAIERTAPVNVGEGSQPMPKDSQSANLLATFLHFTSIALLDTRHVDGMNTAKLCLITLTCIAEDQCANAFLHDANMAFCVPIYRANMYHRQIGLDIPKSQPLACIVIDLMVEFIVSHMTKNFPLDLYKRGVAIIHRCLCYQKRYHIRLQYGWKSLWSALMNLLKFMVTSEASLLPQCNVFELGIQVVNIFNLFITYGDTFLPSPSSYDELYYEIIRVHQIFDNLYTLTLRYVSMENDLKLSASRLSSCLVNVRAIIHHFCPKIDSWSVLHKKTSLTEDEVLEVIRGSYETLTLKLIESLDAYPKYSEQPHDSAFFTGMTRSITSSVRGGITITSLQILSILQEFSSIT